MSNLTLKEVKIALTAEQMPKDFKNIVEVEAVKNIIEYSDLLKSEFEQTIRFVNGLKTAHMAKLLADVFYRVGGDTSLYISEFDKHLSEEKLNEVISNANNQVNKKMWIVLEEVINLRKLKNYYNSQNLFDSKVLIEDKHCPKYLDFNAQNIQSVLNGIDEAMSVEKIVKQANMAKEFLDINFMLNGNVQIKHLGNQLGKKVSFDESREFYKTGSNTLVFMVVGLLMADGGLNNQHLYDGLGSLYFKEHGIEWNQTANGYSLRLNKEVALKFQELTGIKTSNTI